MKVLVSDPLAAEAVNIMKDAGFEIDETKYSPEELVQKAGEFDAILVRSATKVTREVIEAGVKGNLKLVGRGGVGLDNIDLVAAEEHNIKVVNTPAASSISVAELAFAMMLAVSRKVAFADRTTRAGEWAKKQCGGVELYKKTLGVIGFGRIGRELAKRAKAFDMDVKVFDIFDVSAAAKELGAEVTTMEDIYKTCDYISLHLPLTDETKHMVSTDQFAMMKKGVIIVNCARGGVVDEPALAEAIKSGHVAGAGVDVYEVEPVNTDNPLLALDQVVLSPHVGGSTKDGQFRVGTELAGKVVEELK